MDSYALFDEPSIVVLSEDTPTPSFDGTTSLNVFFYVTLSADGRRSHHRETDYVVPRATLTLIIEQDGITIEAVVHDGVAQQQQPPSESEELIIVVSVVSGVIGSILLIAFLFIVARAMKKWLKR